MTKRNPIPIGSEKQHYITQRCVCGRPYITNIPTTARPTIEREPMEPDYSVPAAIAMINTSIEKDRAMLTQLILSALAFCAGLLVAILALSY